MTFLRAPLRSGWLLGAFAACLVAGTSILALHRTSLAPRRLLSSPVQNPQPSIRFSQPLAPSGTRTQEVFSAMNDLSPLFLPSDRNARLPVLPLREPGDGTLDAPTASFSYREAEAAVLKNFPPIAALSGKPVSQSTELDGLRSDETASIAAGFGRRVVALAPASPRGALVEIYASGSGQIVEIKEISEGAHPAWPQVWQPLEFLAAVDGAGLVSPLSLTIASRVESVDSFFRDYLVRTFRVGERLSPGFYRIVVSP